MCNRFLFRFTGDESEINLAGDGSEAAEFSEWKWLPVEEVISNVCAFFVAIAWLFAMSLPAILSFLCHHCMTVCYVCGVLANIMIKSSCF